MSFLTSWASPSLCGPDFFPSIIFLDCAPLAILSTTHLASSPQPANKLKSWKSLKNKLIFPFQLPSYFSVFPFTDHIESVICIVVSTLNSLLPSVLYNTATHRLQWNIIIGSPIVRQQQPTLLVAWVNLSNTTPWLISFLPSPNITARAWGSSLGHSLHS